MTASRKTRQTDPSQPLKNRRHEAFALDVFSGMKASNAYRKHYATSRMKDKTVHEEAARLHRKVTTRIEHLQNQVASDTIMSKTALAAMYSGICETLPEDHPLRVQAGRALSQLMGYDSPKKMEHSGENGSPIETKSVMAFPKELVKALK